MQVLNHVHFLKDQSKTSQPLSSLPLIKFLMQYFNTVNTTINNIKPRKQEKRIRTTAQEMNGFMTTWYLYEFIGTK